MESDSRETQGHGYEDNRFENVVSPNFHCPICHKVLKEPKMCRSNEHVFCTHCIIQHLANTSTCPLCITMPQLTVETLNRAPRAMLNYLSELTMKCDYYSRGCSEFVTLGDMEAHIINCGFAPIKCSNMECARQINKRDRMYHETEECEFRKVKCHDCGEMNKEMNKIKDQLDEQAGMKDQLDRLEGMEDELRDELSSVKGDVKDIKAMMSQLLHKLNHLEHSIEILPSVTEIARPDIIIAGGCQCERKVLNSVETFSWKQRAWSPLPPMNERRSAASSLVYKNQIYVAGGYKYPGYTNTIEMLTIGEQPLKWTKSCTELSFKSYGHKTVVYQDSLIHIGGYNVTEGNQSDAIVEVRLTLPYSTSLCRMPQSRLYPGVEIFEEKVVIMGGKTSFSDEDSLDSVVVYDVHKKECKQMPSLPRAISGMATVSWRDNVVVIGGVDKNGQVLNDVLMYHYQTGVTNILPSMHYKRCGCTAVVTGNVIVVVGGKNANGMHLNSVECFSFCGKFSWEEIPPTIESRCWATAVAMHATF